MHVTVQFVKVLQYMYVLYTKIRLGNVGSPMRHQKEALARWPIRYNSYS